jgi:hypothetical protein
MQFEQQIIGSCDEKSPDKFVSSKDKDEDEDIEIKYSKLLNAGTNDLSQGNHVVISSAFADQDSIAHVIKEEEEMIDLILPD